MNQPSRGRQAAVMGFAMRIGVDTGGTFTDCVVLEKGRIKILKVFSAPDTAGAILDGVRRLAGDQRPSSLEIVHGTTVGTNSLLERRGARVALVTTAGFEDLIEIGRQARPRLYDLNVQREPPLVARALRWGVSERSTATGEILSKPSAAGIRRLIKHVKRSGAESIAICFLFSFLNPKNEQTMARAFRTLGVPISVSHEILPEFREYERLSTTVINAYLAPRMGEYLARLERAVGEGLHGPPVFEVGAGESLHGPPALQQTGEAGLHAPHALRDAARNTNGRGAKPLPYRAGAGRVFVMQSSGGIATAQKASREPVRTILSGPAGGVVAAAWLAKLMGIKRAISFDMGGTSTDVCLLDGPPRTTNETTLGGLPVAVPVLDVHSVGAGGGSIARIDAGGALRVGPESAGAVPGPICYARGGRKPTVTDANLLLGRIDPGHFLGGTFELDPRAVEDRFAEFLRREARGLPGAKQGLQSPLDLARGIVAVSNATMERAFRIISVERGHDPRDFSLICFGGAGPLHAVELARLLRLAQVIVPQNPGAFSALGILLSDIVKDASQSVLLPVLSGVETSRRDVSTFRDLESRFARLERRAREELRREGFPAGRAQAERRLDLRYAGQSYELSVPFARDFQSLFHVEHERAYGYAQAGRQLEIVNLRLRLAIRTPKPPMRARAVKITDARKAMVKEKPVGFGRRFWPTAFYDRERLHPGAHFPGPAVVVEYSSTTVVPPEWSCRVDEYLNLVLSQDGG